MPQVGTNTELQVQLQVHMYEQYNTDTIRITSYKLKYFTLSVTLLSTSREKGADIWCEHGLKQQVNISVRQINYLMESLLGINSNATKSELS